MIIIKAILVSGSEESNNKEIKRISMPRTPDELTFDELHLVIFRLFKERLIQGETDLTLKYYDEDDDLVNLESDEDIGHALSLSNTIKIQIKDRGHTKTLPKFKTKISNEDAAQLKSKLKNMQKQFENLSKSVVDILQSIDEGKEIEKVSNALTEAEISEFLPSNTNESKFDTYQEFQEKSNNLSSLGNNSYKPPDTVPEAAQYTGTPKQPSPVPTQVQPATYKQPQSQHQSQQQQFNHRNHQQQHYQQQSQAQQQQQLEQQPLGQYQQQTQYVQQYQGQQETQSNARSSSQEHRMSYVPVGYARQQNPVAIQQVPPYNQITASNLTSTRNTMVGYAAIPAGSVPIGAAPPYIQLQQTYQPVSATGHYYATPAPPSQKK